MRKLNEIARDILEDVQGNARIYSEPYLRGLLNCDNIEDNYFQDSARSMVAYALSNLTTWRGSNAKVLKAELKAHLK